MSFLTTHSIRLIQVLVASTVIITLFFTVSHFGSDALKDNSIVNHVKNIPQQIQKTPLPFSSSKGPPEEWKPANKTLDFQEIIYVSMPYRTDRQDAMSLIAARAGLKLTLIPGVTADSIHPKAMPPHVGNNNMTGTPALGVWRAHANVWKYMLDNDVESALVIEDDVDFDVNIKEIMGKLNWQLRFNNTIRWGNDVEKGWGEECPYGCDWDEIFVGSCGGKPNRDRLDLHSVYEDAHAPNVSSLPNWVRREMTTMWNLTETEGVRVISPTWEPLCTMGYGLSRMGAMRMLYQIGGWKPFGFPVDLEIAWRTAEGKLSGYTITPPAITAWRVGGAQDSDNDAGMDASAVSSLGNTGGKSEGIKNSVRKSLAGFLEKDYWGDRARAGR